MVTECSDVVRKGDLAAALTHPSFANMFASSNRIFMNFLFQKVTDITNLAFGISTPDIEATPKLTRAARYCLTTPAPLFSAQLTTCRPLLKKMNEFISAETVSRETATVFCMILEFLVETSNGFVLVHFPERLKLLGKLVKHIDLLAVRECLFFLTFFGDGSLVDFLQQSDAITVLFEHLGNDDLVNERILSCMSNVLSVARTSKLADKFQKRETIDKLLWYCFNCCEAVSVASFRFITSFCNHLYDSGGDCELVLQLEQRMSDLCKYVMKGNKFTKSKSLAIVVITRVLVFKCGTLSEEVIDLLRWMFELFQTEKQQTFLHSSCYELLKLAMAKDITVIQKLGIKELIMKLYEKKGEVAACYWGFLHRISGLLIRWRGFSDYVVSGWDEFVRSRFNEDEQLYLSRYGGLLPNMTGIITLNQNAAFPSLSGNQPDASKSIKPVVSQPNFNKVSSPRSPVRSKSTDSEEDTEYDYEDFESEVQPPEIHGDLMKWVFRRFIREERVQVGVRLEIMKVVPTDFSVDRIMFSPDDSRIAFAGEHLVEVFSMGEIETLLFAKEFPGKIQAATFVGNDRMAFLFDGSPLLTFVDLQTDKVETFELMVAESAVFSRDGTKLACVRECDTVIYNVDKKAEIQHFTNDCHFAYCATFSPNGETVAVSYDHGVVEAYSIATADQLISIEAMGVDPRAVLVNDAGSMLITGGDETVMTIWETDGDALQWRTLRGHKGKISVLAMDREQRWVVSGGRDANINMSSLGTREMIYSISAHTSVISAVQFSSQGLLFASACDDGLVKIWKIHEIVK